MFIDRRTSRFAAALSATAGFVDAVGWLTSGGLFVSFMSGNVTKLGLGLAGHLDNALLGAGLLCSFVGGVVLGSLVGRAAGRRQQRHVLWLVTGMMALAAALLLQRALLVPAVLLLAAAMGAKNTVFAEDGEVKVGLTYMTGALVRVGKRIATALHGGDRLGWVAPLLLFLSMLAGATLGGLAFMVAGPRALWAAVAVMVGLSLYSERLPAGR
jgi:uncharacterized membrane protein YoaK (UPF0700 family)